MVRLDNKGGVGKIVVKDPSVSQMGNHSKLVIFGAF